MIVKFSYSVYILTRRVSRGVIDCDNKMMQSQLCNKGTHSLIIITIAQFNGLHLQSLFGDELFTVMKLFSTLTPIIMASSLSGLYTVTFKTAIKK